MAKFLIEKAPLLDGQSQKFSEMQRKTVVEKERIYVQDRVIKCLVELCIERCIRPELMENSLDKLVSNIVDLDYINF